MTRSVLISGGGIAGPSLAYWLGRAGYAVTVVERAPGVRGSGAAPVDFRGDQLALLERMGVLDDIQANQTGMGDQTVIDAEGRRAFGEESRFRHDLGLTIAGFAVPNTFGLDHSGLIYNEPGRLAMVASGRDRARVAVGLMFAGPAPDYDWRDTEGQKRLVAEHFAGVGWQVPTLLAALRDAPELYFDTIGQIRLDRWSAGRVVLLGDAAWCTGPGGNGTGHAMLGAYTLAGELALAGGDFAAAFRRYELIMRPAVAKSQKNAAGAARFLTPATERKIRSRNHTFRILSSRPMTGLFGWLAKRTANTGKLREYPLPYPARSPAAASK